MTEESTSPWNANFIKFVTAQAFSFIGKALMRFALPLYILLMTGDAALMGGILAVSAIPSILISPISGVVVDRVKKNKLLAVVNITTSIGIVIFWLTKDAVGIIPATIFMMLVLLTADSLTALTGKSSVSLVSPPDAIVRSNSILFLAISVSVIVTPVLGGFALGGLGISSVLVISLAFLLAAATLNLQTHIPNHAKGFKDKWFSTAMSDMKAGFRFTFVEKPKLGRVMVLVNMLFCVTLFSMTTITLPVLMTEYFSYSEETLGMVKAIVGIGGIIGTLLVNHYGERASIRHMRPILMVSSLLLLPLTAVFLWSGHDVFKLIVLSIVVFFMFGFNGMLIIIGRSYFGKNVPADRIGKVTGINGTFVLIGVALGGYFYGWLFDYFAYAPWIVFLILAAIALMATCFARVERVG